MATSPRGVVARGEVAPSYPVSNVADFAAHLANSLDVVVTMHDYRQPLCVDGIVSNGHWGPPRPQSAAAKETGSPTNREAEKGVGEMDASLQLSPSQFHMPQEKEIRMDLRWHLHHVTATIVQAFGLRVQGPVNDAQGPPIWLLHGAPSGSCEEPLNAQPNTRTEQTTLKDLQRSAMYISAPTKKPLHLHAIELPAHIMRQALDRGSIPLCVSFL
jgi:hypothetical protein